jgi:hypothetical protein
MKRIDPDLIVVAAHSRPVHTSMGKINISLNVKNRCDSSVRKFIYIFWQLRVRSNRNWSAIYLVKWHSANKICICFLYVPIYNKGFVRISTYTILIIQSVVVGWIEDFKETGGLTLPNNLVFLFVPQTVLVD